MRLKNIKSNQYENTIKKNDQINGEALKKLRETVDFAEANLVKFKMLHNDLLSTFEIQKVKFAKQMKVRDFEIEIMRREIMKFNSSEIDD